MFLARGDTTANGVIYAEHILACQTATHNLGQAVELIDALCCLREEIYRTREIDLLQILLALHNYGILVYLTDKTDNLGVTALTENNHRTAHLVHSLVGRLYLALQGRNYGTGGIDNLNAVLACQGVGLGRLAVSANKHSLARNGRDIFVRDSVQAE